MGRAALMCAALLAAGCGTDGGVRVEGPAPPSGRPPGPVYVVAYMGDPLQRPSGFALDEFSSMTGIRWESWGGETATGTGGLGGTWCLPACQAKPYPAKIILDGLTWRERSGYYGRFTVRAEGLPAGRARELTGRRLSTPEF